MKNTEDTRSVENEGHEATAAVMPGMAYEFALPVRRRGLDARTDREAVAAWLARFIDSPNTLANSRRESERLLLWAEFEAGKSLAALSHEDMVRFRLFLADPKPADRWVMKSKRKLPRDHPAWRPFSGSLSPASIHLSQSIINSMLSWFVEAGYLHSNPLVLSRRRSFQTKSKVARFLDAESWDAVKRTVSAMPEDTPKARATKARLRWLFTLLFLCGLRISEAAAGRMGEFHHETNSDGTALWWLSVTGKGGKTRLVPASAELMDELASYRTSLNLPPIPVEGETTPLLLALNGDAKTAEPLTRAAIHHLVKALFATAAQHVEATGGPEERAKKLRAASAHWLRHTAGSLMAKSADLSHVRDTLGHASLTTTNIYLHSEDAQRHRSITTALKLVWNNPDSRTNMG